MVERGDFDAAAATWDEEPRRVILAEETMAAIGRTVQLNREMSALDFGCGTGLLTLLVRPQVGRITGADSSAAMLEVLGRKVRERGLTNVMTMLLDARAWETVAERFDLITCHMTMHHVEDIPALVRRFHELLNPGGILCLSDLDAEDGSFHADPTGVFHHGLDRGDLREILLAAGFDNIQATTASVIRKQGDQGERSFPVFLITAVKAG